jgi:hypothetical protein
VLAKNESLSAFKANELRNDNNNFAGAVRGSGKQSMEQQLRKLTLPIVLW